MKCGGGVVAEEYVIAEICERFGWTWDEYFAQPTSFLRTIREKLQVQSEIEKENNK